jgi:hypothetical protein
LRQLPWKTKNLPLLEGVATAVSVLAVDEIHSLAVDEIHSLAVDEINSLAVDEINSLAVNDAHSLSEKEGTSVGNDPVDMSANSSHWSRLWIGALKLRQYDSRSQSVSEQNYNSRRRRLRR